MLRFFDLEQGKYCSFHFAWMTSQEIADDLGKEFMCLTKFEASCLKHDSPSDAEEEDGEEEFAATNIMRAGKRRYNKMCEKMVAAAEKKAELSKLIDNNVSAIFKAKDLERELLEENLFLEQEKKKADKAAELEEFAVKAAFSKLKTQLLEAQFAAAFAEDQVAELKKQLAEERALAQDLTEEILTGYHMDKAKAAAASGLVQTIPSARRNASGFTFPSK